MSTKDEPNQFQNRFYIVAFNTSPLFVDCKPRIWLGMTSKEAGAWCKQVRDFSDNGSGYERIGKRAWARDLSSYAYCAAHYVVAVGEWHKNINLQHYRIMGRGVLWSPSDKLVQVPLPKHLAQWVERRDE